MVTYINRQTILDDLDIDIQVTNKRRLSAKESHCVEDRMCYAKRLDHLRGFRNYIKSLSPANVVEKEMILDFIEDNRPTDIQTDWERGCAYICDEIEKLLL